MLPNPHAMLDESERRLYTLLALNELGSCTHLQLLFFMAENSIMTDFDLSLALPELVSQGHAARAAHPTETLYQITEAGREALAFFSSRLPHSKAELIRSAAPAWRERFAAEQQYPVQITQNPGGGYTARFRIVDGAAALLELDIPLPERGMARRLAEAWPRRADEIYQYLMQTLGEDGQTP